MFLIVKSFKYDYLVGGSVVGELVGKWQVVSGSVLEGFNKVVIDKEKSFKNTRKYQQLY